MGRVSRCFLAIATITLLVQLVPARALAEAAQSGAPAAEIAAFFDEYLPTKMRELQVAGATVAVVQGDRVSFSKGYGMADVERQIPVVPEKTLFILGSLSKVFTWTAVMQLVERGMLDLDTDVNRYLDFPIPATFPQPITLHHLMAHNAGLDDSHFGQMTADASKQPSLGDWLKSHLPRRVYPPGTVTAYANYGAALAGYIVERVSGRPFADYVDQNILSPLGMKSATAHQPLPERMREGMSKGYVFTNGKYTSQQSILDAALNPAPAGAIRATAADMTRFMLAHLNGGCAGNSCILRAETTRQMHEASFPRDARVNGMAHGFWQLSMNGQHIIGHAGSHFIFSGMLLLFPEHRLGVYVGSNSAGGRAFLGESYVVFLRDFVQRVFPRTMPPIAVSRDFAQRGKRLDGTYHLTTGQSHDSPERVFSLMSMGIDADPAGLTLHAPWGEERYVETAPMEFREIDRDTRLVFQQDGSVIKAYYSVAPLTELIKNRWFEAPNFNLSLLGGCIVTFLSYLVMTAIAVLRHPGKAGEASSTAVSRRLVRWAGVSVSLVGLALLGGIAFSLANFQGLFLGHLPGWILVRLGSVAFAGLASLAALSCIIGWRQSCQAWIQRIHFTFVSLAGLALVWFMYFWNLLGHGW